MTDSTLSDELQRVELEKTEAEIRKLEVEIEAAEKSGRSEFWLEAIKIAGAVILGIGGIVAAVTQHEIAKLEAKLAEQVLRDAKGKVVEAKAELNSAEQLVSAAQTELTEAVRLRDAAVEERRENEVAVKELRDVLAELTSTVEANEPQLIKDRLVYIQFRGLLKRELINKLRDHLGNFGFKAPGAERIAENYRSIVKYFVSADRDIAEKLATETENFFQSKGCPLRIEAVEVSTKLSPPPPLEIWLHHSCSAE